MSSKSSVGKWPKQKAGRRARPVILERKTAADSFPLVERQLRKVDGSEKDSLPLNSEQEFKKQSDGNKTPADLVSVPFSQTGSFTCLFTPNLSPASRSPLPFLKWADSQEVWDVMVKKDATYPRNPNMFLQHPALNPRMRTVLFGWLIEVCNSYKLHRETLYLAFDFVDRYLNNTTSVPKEQLQLIGITALFIAAKIEEICSPGLADLVELTAGSCTKDQALCKEMAILKSLNWILTPVTTNSWLNICLQVASRKCNPNVSQENFLIPNLSTYHFLKLSQLLDVCMLDVDCLQFSYRTLAAAAIYLTISERIALSVSGLSELEIIPCAEWMTPFAAAVNELGEKYFKVYCELSSETYNIQIWTIELELFDEIRARQHRMLSQKSPNGIKGVLTPPHSGKKRRRLSYQN